MFHGGFKYSTEGVKYSTESFNIPRTCLKCLMFEMFHGGG